MTLKNCHGESAAISPELHVSVNIVLRKEIAADPLAGNVQ